MKKQKKHMPKVKLADAYHRTMASVLRLEKRGLIKLPEEREKHFNDIYKIKLAEDVSKIRSETKEALYRGIIMSATLSILISWFASSVFLGLAKILDVVHIVFYILVTGGVVFLVLFILIKKLKDLAEGKTI